MSPALKTSDCGSMLSSALVTEEKQSPPYSEFELPEGDRRAIFYVVRTIVSAEKVGLKKCMSELDPASLICVEMRSRRTRLHNVNFVDRSSSSNQKRQLLNIARDFIILNRESLSADDRTVAHGSKII